MKSKRINKELCLEVDIDKSNPYFVSVTDEYIASHPLKDTPSDINDRKSLRTIRSDKGVKKILVKTDRISKQGFPIYSRHNSIKKTGHGTD